MTNFFFAHFPTVEHSGAIMTNITLGYRIKEIVLSRGVLFYNYVVKDSDTPQIIADKYYNDSTLDWVVLLTNKCIDPNYDWPLPADQFTKHIHSKYGSYSYAAQTIKEYRQIIQAESYTDVGEYIPERTVVVDEETYLSLSANERKSVTYLEYETELNETKRNIKLLDVRYLSDVIDEYRKVFRNITQ